MNSILDMTVLKNRLVEMLENGIEMDNGEVRKIEPMDYFEITDIDPKKLYNVLKENTIMSPHERRVIISFISKYNSLVVKLPKDKFVEKIMKERLVIKGIEITQEMKEEAISFMEMYNIPWAYYNYISYMRRVVEQLVVDMKRD